ncbi:hypothetical protein ACFVTM_01265 [Arthrobacter sp. NPDC058130]|uniref:hypothetical protein n=1 Tax=Arthrobacter sp. NPDC058130 TaxID=3346353 RepID=UPI0036EB8CB0
MDLSGLELTHYRIEDEGSQKPDLETGEATPLTPLVGFRETPERRVARRLERVAGTPRQRA